MQMKLEAEEAGRRSGFPDVFVPEAVLPEQYFDRWASRASDTPEKRLMFAVLLDAVNELQGRNAKAARQVEEWIRGDNEAEVAFSFRSICDALKIDPDYLGRGLLTWRERSSGAPYKAPLRQLRISYTHVTPLRRRRSRRLALAS